MEKVKSKILHVMEMNWSGGQNWPEGQTPRIGREARIGLKFILHLVNNSTLSTNRLRYILTFKRMIL